MVKEIRHIGFSVRNEEKALKFYCNLLGFKVVKKEKENENFAHKILKVRNIDYIKLEKDGQLIELYVMPKDCEKGRWNHIAFTVENIDDIYLALIEEKIKFISEPTIDTSGTHKLCFCRDYDGNLIELVEELGGKRPVAKLNKGPQVKKHSQEKPEVKRVSPNLQKRINERKPKQITPSLKQRIAKTKGKEQTITETDLNKEYTDSED